MITGFNNSFFSKLINYNDPRVESYADNLYEKIRQLGILPVFVQRDKFVRGRQNIIDKSLSPIIFGKDDRFTFGYAYQGTELGTPEGILNIEKVWQLEFELCYDDDEETRSAEFLDGFIVVDPLFNVTVGDVTFSDTGAWFKRVNKFQVTRVRDIVTLTVNGVSQGNQTLGADDDTQFGTVYQVGGVPMIQGLELTFDDIANVPVADASSVSDWNTFFDLPTNGSPFTSVEVIGNMVRLIGGSGITLKIGLFFENINLLKIEDDGLIDYVEDSVFVDCVNLNTVVIPNLITLGIACFAGCVSVPMFDFPILTSIGGSCFERCLASFNLPELTISAEACFLNCTSTSVFNFPKLTTIGEFFFYGCTSATEFTLPLLANMGGTTGGNYVFGDLLYEQIITLTIPAALMTCNGGNPDGDIQYLIDNNTVTIVTV